MPHPDFELYDNAGRSTEQINAYNTGMATTDDLYRWARRDGADFLTEHLSPPADEPAPRPRSTAILAALPHAQTPAEISALTNDLLQSLWPDIEALIQYLQEAAKTDQLQSAAPERAASKLLVQAAGRLLTAMSMANEADTTLLRSHYDPPAAQRQPPHSTPTTIPPAGPPDNSSRGR